MRLTQLRLRRRPLLAAAGSATFALLLLYMVRPIGLIHGTAMLIYKYPLIWKLPLAVGAIAFAIGVLPYLLFQRRKIKPELARLRRERRKARKSHKYSQSIFYRPYRSRFRFEHEARLNRLARWYRWPAIAASTMAILAFVFAMCTAGMFTGQAIYEHYKFTDIGELPANGKARILPKQVAEQLAASGYNSPTSRLAQAHIVLDADGKVSWTFGEVPNGFWRKYTAKTQGVATLNAESTSRNMKLAKRDFDVSTNVRWTDDLKWQAYKRHFFTDVAETVYVVTASGEPVIIAPYLKYVGFWVKVPELAGVYVVHPDGTMEDLSPEEAERRPFIVQSGRMFPEQLARRIQESYQYRGGIANRIFTHRDQTQIADTESNSQPYLMDFGREGTKWVSTAQPYGRAQATNAIFLTDTITGRTSVWHVPEREAYTGNSKALDIVRALSMPGITFAASDAVDSAGKFEAIEPRPIIVGGRLQFMVSVIPNSKTTVTKTVIVDAKSNKAVAVFDHDTDPGADRRLKDYLRTGVPPESTVNQRDIATGESRGDASDGGPGATSGASPPGARASGAELREIVDRLLRSNRAQQRAILELERQLQTGK